MFVNLKKHISIRNVYIFLLTHYKLLGFFTILFLILLTNAFHFTYPDEFDNITGGYFISQGRLPYTGFFTHHGPFAYFFSYLIVLFSGASFVAFRILLSISYLLMALGFYLYLQKRFSNAYQTLNLVLISFMAVGATYNWGHMLLADSLAGLLILPAYIIVLLLLYSRDKIRTVDIWIIAVLSALTLLTSITYIYAIAVLYLFLGIVYCINYSTSFFSIRTIKHLGIVLLPYILFIIYLLVTKSWSDFYYQAIYFNKEYYISGPNGASPAHNPIRFAVTIFFNFYQNFRAILNLTKDLNFGNPFSQAQALGDFLIIIFFVIQRRFAAAVFVFLEICFISARSNPYTTSETDYQAMPYYYLSIFNGLFLIDQLWKSLNLSVNTAKKVVFGFMLIFVSTYYIFLFMMLFDKGFEKAYLKFMGQQSTIYNRPAIANILNSLLEPTDYYYIGPFAFEEHLYMKAQLASKYFITIPAMDKSSKIQSELISDLESHPPKIIVFNTEYMIFGQAPGRFLNEYIKNNYINLEQLRGEGLKYKSKVGRLGDFDLERHFFLKKSDKDELLQKLQQQQLLILE
jgi:hypothetical protein